METSTPSFSPSEFFNSLQPMMESAEALNQVFTGALEEMRKIQSESYAATLAESMLALAPALMPGGATHSVWQIPSWYQSQAERTVHSTVDSFAILAQSQQQILELLGASLTQSAQQTARAISEVNATFASRRVSAEVLDFSDRRARAQAESQATAQASQPPRAGHRGAKKSAG